MQPGARLVREWHGRTYEVQVIEDGFEFDGKAYRSLSMVAHEITGARWSGPRFFGLSRREARKTGVAENSVFEAQPLDESAPGNSDG